MDQTCGYFSGGAASTAELDTRVVEMDQALAEMFRQTLREDYGFSDQDLAAMSPPLMAEPRAFGTIRLFCAAGGLLFLLGAVLLVRCWRRTGAKSHRIRKERTAREARPSYDPEIR